MPERVLPTPASDFRDRLIIDRYRSVLSRLPLYRQAALGNPSAPDADIWNVFRTLEQIDPALWIPPLLERGGILSAPEPKDLATGIAITLWKRVKPPAERLEWLRARALRGELHPPVGRKRKGRVIPLSDLLRDLKARARSGQPLEEPVEADVIVKCPGSVIFIEVPGPEKSPDEPSHADRARTRLLRLLDAGLSYAAARSRANHRPVELFLLILGLGEAAEKAWASAVRPLHRSPARLRRSLPHRGPDFDPAAVAGRLGTGNWTDLESLLRTLRRTAPGDFETNLLDRLLESSGADARPAAS